MKQTLLGAIRWAARAAAPARAQTGTPDVAVVKVTEASDYLLLDIARADRKPERREFKRRDLRPDGASAEAPGN